MQPTEPVGADRRTRPRQAADSAGAPLFAGSRPRGRWALREPVFSPDCEFSRLRASV